MEEKQQEMVEEVKIPEYPEVIMIALGEIGVEEDAGEDEDKAGRIAEYRSSVSEGCKPNRPPEAWCADFVSWCFAKIGRPLGLWGGGFRSCSKMMAYIKDLGFFFEDASQAQAGDIVFIDQNLNGRSDHCGLLLEKSEDGSKLTTIEGNYSDKVAVVVRTKKEYIMGFARVA